MLISINDVPRDERHLLFCSTLNQPRRRRRRRRHPRHPHRALAIGAPVAEVRRPNIGAA